MKNETIKIPQEGCHVGDENEEIKGSNDLNEAVEVSDNTVHTKRKQMFDEQESVNLQGWDELYNPLLNGNYTIEQAVKVLGDIYEPKRIRISDEAKSNEHQEQSDPHNRNISDFTEKEIQDKRTKSSKNIPVAQAIKQIDKQPISQTAHSLELALPKKVNKTYPKVDYVQLYQSIQSVITRETFCDILELSIDTFQKLLEYEEVVPDQSANSESEHIDKKEKLTHKIISTIEELRSREKAEENLNCTNKVKEACVLLWRSERLTQKELCDKLNISDGNLRRWNYRYDQALGNKNTITTLEDLKNRELGPGNLSCPAEVKAACVRLLKNKEMTKKQICEYYHLVPKTLHNWNKNYDLLLKEIERKSHGLQTFSTSVGNAKITATESNIRIEHKQDTSPNLIFGGRT
ncbi:hypothetical protein [Enterococcus sp. C57]|uniref:hypothetical protein n=1 Tax=Enterococcus sp. C57 TaxID=3231318 RepID=UPI0034A05053